MFNFVFLLFFLLELELFLLFSNDNHEKRFWIGKESLKIWRRMYLELFDYFVNNHDIPPNTTLPLSQDLLYASYHEPSSHFVEDRTFLKSRDGSNNTTLMGGLTMQSIEKCLQLLTLFLNDSESVFRILKLPDYKTFRFSLLKLQSILVETMNMLFNTVINIKVNNKKLPNVEIEKNHENIKMEDIEESNCKIKNENETKMDDEHKDDDVEDNSLEENIKHDDSDSMEYKNETECMSWAFNEDITCIHGKF